jgi:hypothetical protein
VADEIRLRDTDVIAEGRGVVEPERSREVLPVTRRDHSEGRS